MNSTDAPEPIATPAPVASAPSLRQSPYALVTIPGHPFPSSFDLGLLNGLDPETVRRISEREFTGTFPIPWAVRRDQNGVADFRQNAPARVQASAKNHLCAICGEFLGKRDSRWFIGGGESARVGMFTDPWMHEGCARFSARICTFLSGQRMTYRGDMPGVVSSNAANAAMIPSEGPFLIEAKKSGVQTQIKGRSRFMFFRAYQIGQVLDISKGEA